MRGKGPSPTLASKGAPDSLDFGAGIGTAMSGFSASEAALEGFRITRENPRAFLTWVGASFAINVLVVVIDAFMPANIRQGLETINATDTPTPAQLLDALILASPILVFALTVMSVMAAAVYRLIFRHDDAHFAYLRLGADEFRLIGVTLIFVFLAIGLVFVVSMVIGVIVALISVAAPNVGAALQVPAAFLSLLIVAAILIRLSLAPVATFAERRIRIFESWQLTRGHFWPLLGAYALAICCFVAVALLAMLVFTMAAGAIVVATGGKLSDVSELVKPQGGLMGYLAVGVLASMVLSSFLSALYNAVIAAPGAVAYLQLHGAPPQPWTAQTEAG